MYSIQTGVFLRVCANICLRICRKEVDSNSMCKGKKVILALIKLIFISDSTSHVRVYVHKMNDLFFWTKLLAVPCQKFIVKVIFLCQAESVKLLSQTNNDRRQHSQLLQILRTNRYSMGNISTIHRMTIPSYAFRFTRLLPAVTVCGYIVFRSE